MNYTNLALDIVDFLRKWGMWQDVNIFADGWRYTDTSEEERDGIRGLRKEPCSIEDVEEYTSGIVGWDCNGEVLCETYANPEHLLDMTFEGPLYQLLNYDVYEVDLEKLPQETKEYLRDELRYFVCTPDEEEEKDEYMDLYMERKVGWDPMEFDSYEEYLELEMGDALEFDDEETEHMDFTSGEEYQDFVERSIQKREQQLREELDFGIEDCEVIYPDDGSKLAGHICKEFNELLACYGLRYEQGFSWTLTTYKKGKNYEKV